MNKRNLYLTNLPVERAQERFHAALGDALCPRSEWVHAEYACGRIAAEPVYARVCSPLYNAAAMDGIAVRTEVTHGADVQHPVTLRRGADYQEVDTGDPIRLPFDAVIMGEDVVKKGDDCVEIRAAAAPWQHIRPIGEDIVATEMLVHSRQIIRPIDIGVLLSGGIVRLLVLIKPRVAVLPTGTEIIEPDSTPGEDSILESNSRMLSAMVEQDGGIAVRFPITPDDRALLRARIAQAVREHEVVLVNAGTSAGREDYTVQVLRELGAVVVHGVASKPGKPAILAVVEGKPVIGLPGYPVAAYLTYQNFVQPLLRALTGRPVDTHTSVTAVLSRRVVSSLKYREYVRVKLGVVDDRLIAAPLARGAGAAMSLVRADGFCVIPQNSEGVEAGENVSVALYRTMHEIRRTLVSIGSHDLILDVLADELLAREGIRLSSTHVGSMAGLLSLRRGEAHLAPIHLLDSETGQYNIPDIRRVLPDVPMALIRGVGRVQGLIVARGNPLGLHTVSDLTHCRFINRQRGAGTRVLLDHLLRENGIAPAQLDGYTHEATTHMAVAAAVQDGSAQAGMGIESAARALGLDFVPLAIEEYDFAVPEKYMELPYIAVLIEMLRAAAFRDKLMQLGGYTTGRCGEVIHLEQ